MIFIKLLCTSAVLMCILLLASALTDYKYIWLTRTMAAVSTVMVVSALIPAVLGVIKLWQL